MTTQRELLTLAEKHRCDAGVRAMLLSIQEATVVADGALSQTQAAVAVLMNQKALEPGYRVSLDNSRLVATSALAASALTRMAADFNSLACILQSLGEDIRY